MWDKDLSSNQQRLKIQNTLLPKCAELGTAGHCFFYGGRLDCSVCKCAKAVSADVLKRNDGENWFLLRLDRNTSDGGSVQ